MQITWSVSFEILFTGESVNFGELPESMQEKILADIKDDFYTGEFQEMKHY